MSEINNTRQASGTAMKPETAAKKLGIYLPAAPKDFQDNAVTHAELRDLLAHPSAWLEELRKTGPHPRPEVAHKLGVSIAALKRHDVSDVMTTEEISALLADQPEWLRAERTKMAENRDTADTAEDSNES